MAAIYQADVWCDDCAEEIKDNIYAGRADEYDSLEREDWEFAVGFDDESLYDSDEYPKGCSDDEESDCPQHCAAGADCINAEGCSDGERYGYFFGNSLTSDGNDYVREAVREDLDSGRNDSPAVEIWMAHYDYIDYGPEACCASCGDWAELNDDDECTRCVPDDDGAWIDGEEGCEGCEG